MKNFAYIWHGSIKGEYEIRGTFNGKPSWISNDHAIWWIPERSYWGIGSLDSLGSDIRALTGVPSDKNDFGWPYDQKYTWYYLNNTAHIKAGANDIKVHCKAKGNTFFENL